MAKGGDALSLEVSFRIAQRLTQAQIVPYLNRAYNLIYAAASWVFDQASTSGISPNVGSAGGDILTSTDLPGFDIGKKISIFNSSNNTPVVKITQDKIMSSVAGYTGNNPNLYSTFRTYFAAGFQVIEMYPHINARPPVAVFYHLLPPVLVNGPNPTTRWTEGWMDDLLEDYTEYLLNRILKWTDYQILESNCIARLKEAKMIYSTERENTGPEAEVEQAEVEKTTIGRN